MKVIQRNARVQQTYQTIEQGDFFLYDNELCIELGDYNAYDLETEEIFCIGESELVTPISPKRITITID